MIRKSGTPVRPQRRYATGMLPTRNVTARWGRPDACPCSISLCKRGCTRCRAWLHSTFHSRQRHTKLCLCYALRVCEEPSGLGNGRQNGPHGIDEYVIRPTEFFVLVLQRDLFD